MLNKFRLNVVIILLIILNTLICLIQPGLRVMRPFSTLKLKDIGSKMENVRNTIVPQRMTKQILSRPDWIELSGRYAASIINLLYPKLNTHKECMHAVNENPIYNFLHRYYDFSSAELQRYSPGCCLIISCIYPVYSI